MRLWNSIALWLNGRMTGYIKREKVRLVYFRITMTSPDFLSYVNTLQGTASTVDLSYGNCLPLVSMPWAMTAWSPQTQTDSWFFHADTRKIQGVRATRQPSPWMGDYGQFVVMPQTGKLLVEATQRSSSYRPQESVFKPHYLKLHLLRFRTTVELVPTERCAIMRFTFDDDTSTRRILLDLPRGGNQKSAPSQVCIDRENNSVEGQTSANNGGVQDNFACYFYAVWSEKINGAGTFDPTDKTHDDETQRSGENIGAFVEFDSSTRCVEMQIATSYVSVQQARLNLQHEIGESSFDELKDLAAQIWNAQLGRIVLDDASEEQRRTFYTCLYRAQLFPHRCYEHDEKGDAFHYSHFDGQIHRGVAYTDNGFWDTHRTVYPLYSILYPEQLGEILEGWLAAYRESGWFPQWPSPGHRGCMIGSHIDAVFADAVSKNIEGFNIEEAYQGLRKHAFEKSELESIGRIGLEHYLKLGYIPDGAIRHATSATLDYAYNDWCLSQIAAKLGKSDDAQIFAKRSLNYRNVYESSTQFMRARDENGAFIEPFNEFSWGGPFVEGSAWQCNFAVQHDALGLAQLMGGPQNLADKLDAMLATPPHFQADVYGYEIHEMTEMALVDFGQCCQTNQPIHHVLYLYAFTPTPWQTEHWTRRVCSELYNDTPRGLPGDEDNGEMASWYIFSTLGFYPMTPGHASYVLTSPVFGRATIHLENGKQFVIEAPQNNARNVYVASRALNEKPYSKRFLSHFDIENGGTLRVEVRDTPNENTRQDNDDLPYSLSS